MIIGGSAALERGQSRYVSAALERGAAQGAYQAAVVLVALVRLTHVRPCNSMMQCDKILNVASNPPLNIETTWRMRETTYFWCRR